MQALREAMTKGITLLKFQPAEAAAMLAADGGGRVSAAEFGKLLADPDMQFADGPEGVSELSRRASAQRIAQPRPRGRLAASC